MINYIITFFVLAVCAALLGFGGLAADFAGIAKFLTALFVVLLIISLIYSAVSGRRTTPLV